MEHQEDNSWIDYKQFKDPVYGYIPVKRIYVSKLIDTQMMQRIKNVAQTGLRPVFSSATHDRFSHSLGVYKFGMEMYESLSSKLKNYINNTCFNKWKLDDSYRKEVDEKLDVLLKHWNTLLAIGCLLHDIGHPVQSHGFEFLYDDPYLDIDYGKAKNPVIISDNLCDEEKQRVFNLFMKLEQLKEKKPEGNLRDALLVAFHDNNDIQKGPIPGSPHECMSAYYILMDSCLRDNVKALITFIISIVSLTVMPWPTIQKIFTAIVMMAASSFAVYFIEKSF